MAGLLAALVVVLVALLAMWLEKAGKAWAAS